MQGTSWRIQTEPPLNSNLEFRCRPKLTEGTTAIQEEAWGAETARRWALLAMEDASNKEQNVTFQLSWQDSLWHWVSSKWLYGNYIRSGDLVIELRNRVNKVLIINDTDAWTTQWCYVSCTGVSQKLRLSWAWHQATYCVSTFKHCVKHCLTSLSKWDKASEAKLEGVVRARWINLKWFLQKIKIWFCTWSACNSIHKINHNHLINHKWILHMILL